jgi:sugar phosphate isomerase/epimerase
LELAAEVGFEGLYVNMADVAEIGPPKVRALFEAKGLRTAGWGLPVDVRGDEARYEQDLKELPRLTDAARELGCLRTSTYILSFSDDLPFAENFDRHRRRLRAVARILSEREIRLGLEFLGPKTLREGHRYEFIHTMHGMLELCDRIGTGNVGLLLDCWHWYTAGGTVDDLRRLEDANVVDVHVNDAPAGIPADEQMDQVRRMPGETGVIDIEGFLKALDEIGYTGPIMAEPFSEKVQNMTARQAAQATAEAMRAIWRKGGLRI